MSAIFKCRCGLQNSLQSTAYANKKKLLIELTIYYSSQNKLVSLRWVLVKSTAKGWSRSGTIIIILLLIEIFNEMWKSNVGLSFKLSDICWYVLNAFIGCMALPGMLIRDTWRFHTYRLKLWHTNWLSFKYFVDSFVHKESFIFMNNLKSFQFMNILSLSATSLSNRILQG